MDIKYTGGDLPWSLPFGDHFNSSNSQETNSELKTIAHRHNFQTLYEQLTNSNNNSKWTNAGVFFTNKTIDSNLTGIHNTDFYDDHNHTFCYLCSINQHQHERTKPRDESKKRKLIPYKNPKALLSSSSSSDRIQQNSSPSLDLISYRFIVRTGTQKNCGTRAQVFLYLYGTEKNWTSIHLRGHNNKSLSTSIDGFPRGSIRTFCFKGPNIGQLHHLNVNLVGSRSDKEWFLKEIEITNLNNAITWLCEFNCWLPKTDEQQINEIKPNVYQQTKLSLSIYILQIRTGEKSIVDTNTNIQIQIRGSVNQTRQLTLINNQTNLFEKNQLDTFAIVGSDLGDLLEIIVESDKYQSTMNWHIKDMIIWKIIPNDDHKQSYVYFPFNICLNKKLNRFKGNKEIYPLIDYHLKGPICYQVIVKTGNVTNAGTDANVFLIIYGKSGRTVIHQLNNRIKNDFERNTISEFTIMDIDIGKIDRIKIWHDNSSLGSAWFLESIIIRKKYSTCQTISNIYIQRLEQISKALYRQINEPMNKNSIDRSSLKSKDSDNSGFNDRLGSSRSILRSPTIYDKVNLRKKVTWDEQSIGSQDDLLSMDSQRIKTMQIIDEQQYNKNNSFYYESKHMEHKIYWISSHNYIDNKWKIKSIEEINSFDFDSSIRSLLLSDRSIMNNNNNIKTSIDENNDEIYEFQANCWLAKDKQDDKLEVYLTPKLIHKSSLSSDVNIDSKKKHFIQSNIRSDIQHKKYDNENNKKESKYSSPYDLRPIEKSSKNSSLHNLRLSSSHLSNTSKTQLPNSHSFQENINPLSRSKTTFKKHDESSRINSSIDRFPQSSSLTQHSKSPRNLNDFINPLSSEQELLARITTSEPSHHPRSTTPSLLPVTQHSKLPWNTNDRTASITNEQSSSMKISNQPPYHPRSSTMSMLSSNENIKLSHNKNHFTKPFPNIQDSLSRIPHELPNQFRSTSTSPSSSNQSLKSLHINNDFPSPIPNEEKLLKRITDDSPYRSQSPTTSLSSLTPRTKLTRQTNNNPTNSLMNKRERLLNISVEPPVKSRSTTPSLLSFNHLPNSSQSNNQSVSSITNTSIESTLGSKSAKNSNPDISLKKSINNQVYYSAYGTSPLDDF
ncbi:unnamed protein product [Rotaria sordida]|uniref:PLAT domain-containing protein n=1 Tax=Rotaria sordida TaxID=392033 RepID=A0A818WHB2_9BILA|nr:unnamed protein product [Rotaria sordida]